MLTRAQKEEFKRNGFLVLEGGIDESLALEARDAVWDAIPEARDDPSTWTAGEYRNANDELDDPTPFEEIDRQAFEYVADLVGDEHLSPPGNLMQVQLRFPSGDDLTDPTATQPSDRNGHVDGFGQYSDTGEVGYTTMAAVAYLDRVQPRGGGFTVWPGSHRILERFFQDHPVETLGELGSRPAAIDGDGWDLDGRLQDQLDPFEISGDAGTLVLWHGKLLHTAGVNHGPNVRVAAIPRFRHVDGDEIKHDVASDIWKIWEGMQDIQIDDEAVPAD